MFAGKITITKRFTFEAAHNLPQHKGKCHHIHGHSYILEVTIQGEKNFATGMIMDFGDLKDIVNEKIVEIYDHKYLNDFFINPTAEIMINEFALILKRNLPEEVELEHLRLYETQTCWVDWFAK